jgi:hypothetical protein
MPMLWPLLFVACAKMEETSVHVNTWISIVRMCVMAANLWSCMNNPKLEESDSEESNDTMVRFDFNLILFGLFNDQYIFL